MDEQLDNELKKRIQEVFENVDDTTADEGWLLLREKFPEEESKRRGLIWFWRGSAAAILFIFLGIGLWYFNKNNNNIAVKSYAHQPVKSNNTPVVLTPKTKTDSIKYLQQTTKENQQQFAEVQKANSNSVKQSGQTAQQGNAPLLNNQKAANNTIKPSQASAKQDQLQLAEAPKPKNKKAIRYEHLTPGGQVNVTESSLADNTVIASKNNKGKRSKNLVHQAAQQPDLTDKPSPEILAANESAEYTESPADKTPGQQFAAITKTDTATVNKAVPKTAKKTIQDMFAADNQAIKKSKKDDKNSGDKRVHFGIYAATYFSYAKGSDQEVNVGGGFSSDIKISNNLKLVTGVAIGQNTLSYSGSSAVNTESPLVAAVATGTTNYLLAATPSIKNYNANLVGLDIPMNLKYELNPQKGDTYILAGLS
jgi:hypothetical protein